MDNNKLKEGVTVKEIEIFAKKHRFEVFFCLAFLLALFFSFVFWGPGWCVIFAAIGAIIGALLPARVELLAKRAFHFLFKQEQTTQLILGVVTLILAIFLPVLIFLVIGLHGGKDLHHIAMGIFSQTKPPFE